MQLLIAEPILQNIAIPNQSAILAIILVGNHPASELYVTKKQEQAKKYGIKTSLIRLPDTITTDDLITAVDKLNRDRTVDALIVQLPLPEHIETDRVLDSIAPKKDADNLTNHSDFLSPMVQAVQALQTHYAIDFTGQKLCVIGRGRLVGQPLTQWLESLGYNPVVVDATTENKDDLIRAADTIFGGSGHRHIIHAGNTREGQIIFDCSGKDADFEIIKGNVAAITPPKGGIGPLTVHFLLTNTILAAQKNAPKRAS